MTETYRGIGNDFRERSQLKLMVRLRDKYELRSVLNCPCDHATEPAIDNRVFKYWRAMKDFPTDQHLYDLVWNFGFIQRDKTVLPKMMALGRYLLFFVPNRVNPGMLAHKVYHTFRKGVCKHPESGDPELMSLYGLSTYLKDRGLKVLEKGYVDCPPWPDTVVTLSELAGYSNRKALKLPFHERLMQFEDLTTKNSLIMAHHCYIFMEV